MHMTATFKARAALICGLFAGLVAAAAQAQSSDNHALDDLRLNQVRIEGSHNSYRKFPSPAEEARIKTLAAKYWPGLEYGHPPLESQLALGLRQLEIDVATDPKGGPLRG